MQAPPGTGKSQTIVNLAGNLLRDGRRVLVSAEKVEALDVIRRRIAGLDHAPAELTAGVFLTERSERLDPAVRFALATPAVAAQIPPTRDGMRYRP